MKTILSSSGRGQGVQIAIILGFVFTFQPVKPGGYAFAGVENEYPSYCLIVRNATSSASFRSHKRHSHCFRPYYVQQSNPKVDPQHPQR